MKNMILSAMIVATGLFVFGVAPALANVKPITVSCLSLEDKKAVELLTCRVFKPNPLGPWIPYPVGSKSCDCPAGYSEFKPFPEISFPAPKNATRG